MKAVYEASPYTFCVVEVLGDTGLGLTWVKFQNGYNNGVKAYVESNKLVYLA